VASRLIKALIDCSESLVYFFSEIPKLKMDSSKLCIRMFLKALKSRVCLAKPGPNKPFQRGEPLTIARRLPSGIPFGHTASLSCLKVIRKSRKISRHGRKFRLGDAVRVRVARINAFRSEIDFELVANALWWR